MNHYTFFESEEEARKSFAHNLSHYNIQGFCPLIRDTCNHKCVCYVPAKLTTAFNAAIRKNEVPAITRGYCCNYMLSGE